MTVIKSFVDTRSPTFRANAEAYAVLLDDLRARLEQARAGGPPEARERHVSRGKLLVRERIDRLIDPATPFLEIGALAAHEVYDEPVPSAGIVTGIGRVAGREVMIVANDATVKAAHTIR